MKNNASKFPLPKGAIWARLPERVEALENPKVIKALVSQTSTNAPVATILKNNTEATLTFSYAVSGVYTITSDKPIFISGKMGVTLGLGANPLLFTYTISSPTQISIVSLSTGFSPANDLLSNNLLTIEIFN